MGKVSRWATVLGLSTFLVLSGFGCKPPAQPVKPVTLEYWTVFDDVGAMRKLVDQYRQVRPYLTVNIRQLSNDELYQRLIEALADDQGPDIISVNTRSLGGFLSKLQPMPASVKDTTIVVEQGQFSNNTIVTPVTRPMVTPVQLAQDYVQTVKTDAMRGGKIYGLPLSLDVVALYYNKDLLDRAGIPEPPKNWEEFQADVKLLTKFDKTSGKIIQAGAALGTGANIPGSSDLLYILFNQSNLQFMNGGRATFNIPPSNAEHNQETPAGVVMNFYTDFANSARDTYSWNETMPNALDSFVNGSLAFFFGYRYQYPAIKARAPQLNFDVLPMLQLSNDHVVNTANYSLQTVLLKSKHPNEAWGLIDYLAHSGATKQYLEATGRPTAVRKYVAEQVTKPELAPFASQVLTADSWYRGRDYAAADKALQAMYSEWLLPTSDDKLLQYHQSVLDRGAAKVDQTL